jgi:DNA-binding ferritin-like protein (Dps family)
MRIIDEDYYREEIEKEMQDFENRLKTISADYVDVEWQTEYILNRKRTILELKSIINCIGSDLEIWLTEAIGYKEHSNILDIIDKLRTRLLEIESSTEDLYKELIQSYVWIEQQKELNDFTKCEDEE